MSKRPMPARYQTMSYESIVQELISYKYSVQQELAIQRQKETKPEEWQAYNDFCEDCKIRAKKIKGLD